MTAYALRIADRSDEVRTIATRISTARRSKIYWLAGLEKENIVELPSADHRVQGARSVCGEFVAAAEWQIADKRSTEDVPFILSRIAIVDLMVTIDKK